MRPVYFIITIDTECDKSRDWSVPYPWSFDNILKAIPGRLQPLFQMYDIRPTYLISPEVLYDPNCIKVLSSLKGANELGTHLHGEYIEPHSKFNSKSTADYQADYSYEIEYEKMLNMTNLFASSFGFRPLSFRAGRFGIGPFTLRILDELGYLADSSIFPLKIISTKHHTLNFHDYSVKPYFPDVNTLSPINRSKQLKIVEVPITVHARLFQWLPKVISRVITSSRTLTTASELLFGKMMTRTHSLRPSVSNVHKLVQVINSHLAIHHENEPVFINMMFHSSEIRPGCSPYTRNEGEVTELLNRIENVIVFLKEINARSITMSECHAILKSYHEAS